MKKFAFIFCVILLFGCSSEKAENDNQATKPKRLFELEVIENGSSLKVSSEKYSWSKILNSDKKSAKDIEPKFIVDSMNKVAFFNHYNDSIYSINIESGELKQKTAFPKVRIEGFRYLIKENNLIISSNQDLFIFNEELKLIVVDARASIEMKELSKAGAIFGDTIDVQNAITPQKSIMLGSNYNLDSISLEKSYQDSILIKGYFSESNKSDTIVKYIIYKR